MNIKKLIQEASGDTPDPERALKNLERLSREAPEFIEEHEKHITHIAGLFSFSQFLADYAIKHPASLSPALKDISMPVQKRKILSKAYIEYMSFRNEERTVLYKQKAMRLLREMKKNCLIGVTLRDISGISSLDQCTAELSNLSEAVIELALDMSFTLMRRTYGLLRENAFSVIGMGKLGADELNYSSDIDIITIYRSEKSISTGILNPFGIRHNTISSHEYFCTLTEILANLLQSPTEDGIAYRVDLRLRPNGRNGALSLPLNSYLSYYESWGKTWERIALIRAKPVAGDVMLGNMFINSIEPFVWKRTLDYNDMEEIKGLKKKIDALSDLNDIKRGYGGIREIEFFVQVFQLLYGGEKHHLRTGRLNLIIMELMNEGLLPEYDAKTLSESYSFFRRIEHVLQMRDDLQTYSLPSKPDDLRILSKKLGFQGENVFTADLRLKRLKVRDMYNSLFADADVAHDVLLSIGDELPENATLDYLSFKGFQDAASALKNLTTLNDKITTGKTIRERTLLRKAVTSFLEEVMRSPNKDRALGMLVTFIGKVGNHESFVDLLLQRNDAREIIIRTFSASTYLTRLLLSLENFEGIFEYPDFRTDYQYLQELLVIRPGRKDIPNAIREFKIIEELKTGMLYLKGLLDNTGLLHTLSLLADTIVKTIVDKLFAEIGFAVIGLGGFGAQELNFGSDLDLLFIKNESGPSSLSDTVSRRFAEEMIRVLSEYTEKGIAYKVDMRLRPDGSGGILVNDISAYKSYYLKSASPWEIQSLLRARPIAGDIVLLKSFSEMQRQIVMQRGKEVTGSVIKDMRKRIIHEISRESSGYDMKLGPGGTKEIEFLTQYLQLKNIEQFPDLIIQNTVMAIKKLGYHAILDRDTEELLLQSHGFLKTIDTFLRLNEEDVLKINSRLPDIIITFLNLKSRDELIKKIGDTRQKVVEIAQKFYG